MNKVRRIFALAGIILLAAMYILTMVFALMKHPMATQLLMAAVFCTVAVPVLLYAMLLVAKNLKGRGTDTSGRDVPEEPDSGRPEANTSAEDPKKE